MNAAEFLNRAATHMEQRARTYDKPSGERSMAATVAAFNAITCKTLTETEGWMLLMLLKAVRLQQRSSYHADSAEDLVAYAALVGEARSQEVISTTVSSL